MMKNIISAEDCAKCQFCCSFRRVSLHFMPTFEFSKIPELRKKYPDVKFIERGYHDFTADISGGYPEHDDGTAESLCCFNVNGCTLSGEYKPFQCKIWPLQVMRHGDKTAVVLTPTCPVTSAMPSGKVRELIQESGTLARIWEYVSGHPEIIADFEEGNEILDER